MTNLVNWMALSCQRAALLLAAVALVFSAGCDLIDGDDDDSSGSKTQTVTITVAAMVGEEEAACDTEYTGMGSEGSTVEIDDMRLYLSNIRLMTDDGDEAELELEQDGEWQYEDVVLLDFEDATGECAADGTTETNAQITGTIKKGTYTGIEFDVGVPFELNHTDTTDAESPLNIVAMGWGWQYGRKFAKIDFIVPMGEDDDVDYNIHLGSTGCGDEEGDGTEPPEEACTYTNLPSIHSHDFDADEGTLTIDLAAFMADVDMTSVTADTAPGCMSGTTDPECEEVFPNFGLNLDSGECDDECHEQTLFAF